MSKRIFTATTKINSRALASLHGSLQASRRRGLGISAFVLAVALAASAVQAQQPAPEPAAPDSDDLINKLKELANLKDQGILTEQEFNDQKAKILAEMS